MWNPIKLLEGAGEGIRQAPHRSRRELWISTGGALPAEGFAAPPARHRQRGTEDQLGTLVADLRTAPLLDLPLHRLEVALDAVHTHTKGINQVEALAVLGHDWRECA